MPSPTPKNDIPAPDATPAAVNEYVSAHRWTICALLFFATTLNYIDRQVLGLLAPMLQDKIGWNELQYGYIVTAFQAAYALGLLIMGRFIDRVGTRIGYAIAVAVWSLAAMSHAAVRSVMGFGFARFALGLGESANFPAAIKTVAEWFPKRERALATGIFNSGTNVGATIAPLVVPWIAIHLGWRYAFLFTGLFSAIWIACWLLFYPRPHEQKAHNAALQDEDEPGEASAKVPWSRLLRYRQSWAFLLGKFMTDPTWWFLSFWLPKFFASKHHLTLTKLGLPLIIVYNAASLGSICGGLLAQQFLKRGWSVNRARKTTLLCCALAVVPIVLAGTVDSLWEAVALVSLATAAHQGWSANLYTITSDMFPRRAVASVVGIGGSAGAAAGMLTATAVGWVLQTTHSYTSIFFFAGGSYLLALGVIHLLVPRMEPAKL